MKSICYILAISLFVFSCKQEKKGRDDLQTDTKIVSELMEDINLSSGTIERIEIFPSEYIQPRHVDIWLPDHYSKSKKYAVLYMHDGQMLFDSTTTWNKQEWKIDEWASKLMNDKKTKDFIVVAMHNISEIRWQDYFPQKAFDFLEEKVQDSLVEVGKENNFIMSFNADNYLKFIVTEVKPFIDANYSVNTDRSNTFISGSSMGGLISMYAICEYPDIFSGAACISTHWPGAAPNEKNPIPNAFFRYMNASVPDSGNHKFYFDFGTKTLDQFYPQYSDEVDAVFSEKGYNDTNFKNLKFEGADHSENSWNKRMDVPLIFLLGKTDE